MDEFFNFDEATSAPNAAATGAPVIYPSTSSYDFNIDLALAQTEADESSFNCMQHFASTLPTTADTVMHSIMSSPQLNESQNPWWTNHDYTREVNPCKNCQLNRIDCVVLSRDGAFPKSCLNCSSLSLSCNIGQPDDSLRLLDELASAGPQMHPVTLNRVFSEELSPDSPRNKFKAYPTPRSSTDGLLRPDIIESAPKVGARFSREAVRILKHWLSVHHRHPYPTDEEKEALKKQTGLNKTQITNWLANARRRGKGKPPPRPTSPNLNPSPHKLDSPRRPTPALCNMGPMERWQRTPPESEAVSVSAISKAITSSSLSTANDSLFSCMNTEDGSARSMGHASSTSSVATGSSGGSFGSALSRHSRGSFGSFGKRGRRRRRRQVQKLVPNAAITPLRQFQCTFCIETFKTKHDWQRHEKSLHLSLERWICAPSGPSAVCRDNNLLSCVFCGVPNPDQRHMEIHNYSNCLERSLEERTFYRKDHLRQHLRLVHDTNKFLNWSMDTWKVPTPEIRSRCGFCGMQLNTWANRVDHLAEHFKTGKSMADWKGDWGFDPQITDMVENCIPPYLIHSERSSTHTIPNISGTPNELVIGPFDVLKTGLMDHVNHLVNIGQRLTDTDLQMEGFRIAYGVNPVASMPDDSSKNWITDLFRPTEDESWAVHCRQDLGPGRAPGTWIEPLTLEQRRVIFERCSLEASLIDYVNTQVAVGITPNNSDLREEACHLLDVLESSSIVPCESVVSWLKYLIRTNNIWIKSFRKRAGLSPVTESQDLQSHQAGISISANVQRLEEDLADFVQIQTSMGLMPSDNDLQNQARWTLFGSYDTWNQTPADDPNWLLRFKAKQGFAVRNDQLSDGNWKGKDISTNTYSSFSQEGHECHWDMNKFILEGHLGRTARIPGLRPDNAIKTIGPLRHFIQDANDYRRLEKELVRFVSSCLSPHSPDPHIPTDSELQQQARWIVFDDNDSRNQTAADNAEWLLRFKRSNGLAAPDEGPGLPSTDESWDVRHGGSGFYPPYIFPRTPIAPLLGDLVSVSIGKRDGTTRAFQVRGTTSNSYIQSFSKRYKSPAAIFCSRELEAGLQNYVRNALASGYCPNDNDLRMWGRKILGMPQTAADDDTLLEKFKAMHGLTDGVTIMPSDNTGAARIGFTSQPSSPGAYAGNLYRPYRNTSSPLSKQISLGHGAMQISQGYSQARNQGDTPESMDATIL